MRKDVNTMCNLSDGIEERAIERGFAQATEKFIINMADNNFTVEQIAIATGKTSEEVKKILETFQPSPV
jgi:hypothetical protein